MKIFNSHIQKAYKIYSKNDYNKSINKISKTNKKDEIQLSSKALEFQYALKAFKEVPEVREEKVKEIQDRIKNGTYEVDVRKIVDNIFS